MPTRPERTHKAMLDTQAQILKAMHDVGIAPSKAASVNLTQILGGLEEEIIDIWTRVPDTLGQIMLLNLPGSRATRSVFHLVASTNPDYRIGLADREIPLGKFQIIRRYECTRILMALERIRSQMKKRRVVHLHDDWYEIDINLADFICRHVVAGVNREFPKGKERRQEDDEPEGLFADIAG